MPSVLAPELRCISSRFWNTWLLRCSGVGWECSEGQQEDEDCASAHSVGCKESSVEDEFEVQQEESSEEDDIEVQEDSDEDDDASTVQYSLKRRKSSISNITDLLTGDSKSMCKILKTVPWIRDFQKTGIVPKMVNFMFHDDLPQLQAMAAQALLSLNSKHKQYGGGPVRDKYYS
ncbi:hypothetical protein OROHE_017984 [Orobanche hederae]